MDLYQRSKASTDRIMDVVELDPQVEIIGVLADLEVNSMMLAFHMAIIKY